MALQHFWTQPISSTRREDLNPGLEARVHDPLWLLCRQWQMGEFQGEDAGTPVTAEVAQTSFPIDQVRLDGQSIRYDPATAPLEMLVERETRGQRKPDLRMRAQAGLRLIQRIKAAGLAVDATAMRARASFVPAEFPEAEDNPKVRLLLTRAPDAEVFYADFKAPRVPDAMLGTLIPGSNAPYSPYRDVLADWVAEYEARTGEPGERDAWIEDRAEYAFDVSIPTDNGRITLSAPEYHGGHLDWDAFSINSIDLGQSAATGQSARETVLVTRAGFLGQPSARFWEFEDARIDFGNIRTSSTDPGHLLLAEFALSWGNDWFLVPVETPLGGFCRIDEVLITDTFGVTTRIPAQGSVSPNWSMNRLSQTAALPKLDNYLFLPPVLEVSHQGDAVEDITLVRDETANMAWAIERKVAGPLGRPRELDEGVERNGFEEPETGARLRYEPITDLPENWVPLLPRPDSETRARYLVRARLLDEVQGTDPIPQGSFLSLPSGFRLHDEEVPRMGVRLTRAYQLARWYDGGSTLWMGRVKQAGTGPIRSDLEFDRLVTSVASE